MKKIALTLLLAGFIGLGAFTQDSARTTKTKRVDTRQKIQRARIADGVVDGEVTRREAAGLRKNQRHIRRAERRAKSDGVVTPRERVRLEKKQDRASRRIRRAKTNELDRKRD